MNHRQCLLNSFQAAISAANPLHVVPPHLPKPPKGRTLVVGAGKASAAMALAVEQHWPSNAPMDGLVITRYGHSLPTQKIKVIEAGHPVPDEQGINATQQLIKAVKALSADDLLICLFSGGGSSLMSAPVTNVSVNDLKNITQQLLKSGATIQEINTIRKHLSTVQGGKLAAMCNAPILALIISDVVGDDPTHIASGPCAPDPTTYADSCNILEYYETNIPVSIKHILHAGRNKTLDETPKVDSTIFKNVENRVISSARSALNSAVTFFQKQGIATTILGDSVTGEARDVAKVYAALAMEIKQYSKPWKPPIALLSGGETTVTVKGNGRGGRNTEFLLSLAIELSGIDNVYAIACDTDGIDGLEDNAGAIITPSTWSRAEQLGVNGHRLLANNDSYHFFEPLNDLIITSPTYTNVNDYRVILIL